MLSGRTPSAGPGQSALNLSNANHYRNGRVTSRQCDTPENALTAFLLISNGRELMTELLFLRREVSASRIGCGDFERKPFGHREPVTLDPNQLPRIVAE